MTTMTTLAFPVRRKDAVLVGPAGPTPRETKCLSDIDDQVFLRKYAPSVFFYRGGLPDTDDRDPVAVVRRALALALVPYYPLAGRLREVDGGELVVDCTGEGVLFVEADADVRLAELEAAGLRPPFPYIDQLLFDFGAGSNGVVNRPLLLIQVTRLLCGGFVLAFRISHAICDGIGTAQFMNAVAELARGLPSPTVSPAWSRELLRAPAGDEHDATTTILQAPPLPTSSSGDSKVIRTFTFSPSEIVAIKMRLPPRLRKTATTFEVLTAALWRARTAALELPPDEQVSLLFACNLRGIRDLGLPAGYYGNAIVIWPVVTTAGEFLARSLGDAVHKVQEAKAAMTAEFTRSTTDPLALRVQVSLGTQNAFEVSDIRHAGFHRLDFGWGEPVYGGLADARHVVSFILAVRNGGGDDAVAVTIMLPPATMDRFASEVQKLLATTLLVSSY